jgi:hypothetical protein
MAATFDGSGKLIAFGNGAGSTDAQHIAVELIPGGIERAGGDQIFPISHLPRG